MQLDITFRAERVSSVNNVCCGLVVLASVSGFRACFCTCRGGSRRIEERGTAFAAEEVELVVESLAEGGVINGDVALINDRCRAVMTPPTELLEPESAYRINENPAPLTSK